MIPRFTLVEIGEPGSDGKPSVRPWLPPLSEEPGLLTTHRILGVTIAACEADQPVATMTQGYLRNVPAAFDEAWEVGSLLWGKADGSVTYYRPTAPLPVVLVGTVYAQDGENWMVDVNVRVFPSLGELSGVAVEAPADKDVFIYTWDTGCWTPRQLDHTDDLLGIADPGAHPASAIEYTPSGDLVSTDVQGAIDELASPRIDDLRFPAQGINPAGSPAPPSVDTATGCLSFAGNLDNVIAGVAQMPHSWNPGTPVAPHLHLRFPTSNAGKNTRWKFEYDIANIGEDFTNNSGSFSALTVITVANPANVKRHVIVYFEDLDMTGYTESSIILWKISRLASSDGADDDTNACLLLEFDVHFEVIKRGTIEGT